MELEPTNPKFLKKLKAGLSCSSTLQTKSLGQRMIDFRISGKGMATSFNRSMPMEERQCSTDLREERGRDRNLGFCLRALLELTLSFSRMGRVKLKIKRLENINGRQATFAKRRLGIMKKASELSILCDIDIVLLMFSPTGKPAICKGKRSNLEEVIAKFAQLTPQERAKRKLESLEALKKTFKKLDHDVNIQEFLGTSSQTIEDLKNEANLLNNQISELHTRLSHWTEIDKINSVEQLGQMENSLRESINQIQSRKENIQKQQFMPLQCTNQFNDIQIPLRMSSELQPLSWIAHNDSQHMVLPDDSNLLLHKDVECSASSSFGSYTSYLGSSTKTDLSNPGQENGVLSDLTSTASLRLQLGGQLQYLPYNFNLLNDHKFQPAAEMNSHENPIDYHPNKSFEAPTPVYETNLLGWAPTAGPCSVTTMFDEHLFGPASFPQEATCQSFVVTHGVAGLNQKGKRHKVIMAAESMALFFFLTWIELFIESYTAKCWLIQNKMGFILAQKLISVSASSELGTSVGLAKGPGWWGNIVGHHCTAVTGCDLEGEALAIEIVVALPILAPVS
ncbi:agamous-like MADS-box protein AGL30 isoform X1 [Senna tora]|uniref:Agamous-like MADS-box protein AGL30 isoform X1 n=1 Tax=Senna tora TaxID=362788 RepID=A0A834SSH6_9FABA|nr:agamous-like MADS-box protein AGL30 isoform X1 [Senna tora]